MRELETVQKQEKLNNVLAMDLKGNGNGNHLYNVTSLTDGKLLLQVPFQDGARNQEGSTPGVLDADLLEIVRDRLIGFQSGEYATEDNAKALEHVEEALAYMNERVKKRIARNVLGTPEV